MQALFATTSNELLPPPGTALQPAPMTPHTLRSDRAPSRSSSFVGAMLSRGAAAGKHAEHHGVPPNQCLNQATSPSTQHPFLYEDISKTNHSSRNQPCQNVTNIPANSITPVPHTIYATTPRCHTTAHDSDATRRNRRHERSVSAIDTPSRPT